ncbi:HAMP domain-containing sensor histidine kinase [Yinghuangia aomiensis]|uniref:histidine kinase n=1 Tax=Yinghuangia aomiensis TaxID=676205 RepID=A0ABP9H4F5_9ACTN
MNDKPQAKPPSSGAAPLRPQHPPRPSRPPRPGAPPKPAKEPSARKLVLGLDPGDGGTYHSRLSYAPDWLRPSIRMRLTALYGGMFLIAGVLLLGSVYLLVGQNLSDQKPPDIRFNSDVVIRDAAGQVISPDAFNRMLEARQGNQRDLVLHSLLQQSLLALVLLSVIAFGFGYVMAGRVLSPLGRITAAARAVAGSGGSGLHRRIDLDGPDDELKELADTFDEMLERLDRAFDSQRKFVANASHELRTPLAINRTLLEVALGDPEVPPQLRELGDKLLTTNERSERLIEGLLLLARSENELTDPKPVDLSEVAGRTIEQLAGEAGDRDVELRGDFEPAWVSGNLVLLERVALNLAQNAVRYNTPGGWVEMSTSTVDGTALLTVANSGPAVPPENVESLFEPFRRLRGDRTESDKGVGLGLSIVRSVARAHGGWIEAEAREEGGLIVRVGFPAPAK